MKRNLAFFALLGFTWIWPSQADAQVFVRAPFVRVEVGGGTYVRAPFVNLWIPPAPVYVGPPPPVYLVPQPNFAPGMPRIVESPASQSNETPPAAVPQKQPLPDNGDNPPQPIQPAKVPSLEQFANNFQPKAGSYEVTIMNPVTNKATPVRFSLPEGTPRRVHVRRNEIEFDYGIRHFVRIEFDNDGAMVISR